MAGHSHDGEDITGINVTPLVDITLVLLIIFMVTAKLVVSQAMPLDLPKAASAGETQTMLTITIDGAGVLRANDQVISEDLQLRAVVASELEKTRDLRAVLSASSKVEHGQVMHVLDVLRGVGMTKVAFGVEKVP